MAKKVITIGRKVEIVEKQVFTGACFSVNENGGMGGGHRYCYAKGDPSDFIASSDANGMVKACLIDGAEKFINLHWCNEVMKVRIMKATFTETKWNGKYGTDSDCEKTGRKITKYLCLGIDDLVEIKQGGSSNLIADFDGITVIHTINPED